MGGVIPVSWLWVTQSASVTLLPPPSGKSDHSLSFQNQGTSDAEVPGPDENSDKKAGRAQLSPSFYWNLLDIQECADSLLQAEQVNLTHWQEG